MSTQPTAGDRENEPWTSPSIVIRPGRCSGQPTVGECRIPAELVAGVMWEHGMGEAESQWEPIVERDGVLLACWYMGRFGSRTWRKRWAAWAEVAEAAMWTGDRKRWDDCPDPPTRHDTSSENRPCPDCGATGTWPHAAGEPRRPFHRLDCPSSDLPLTQETR